MAKGGFYAVAAGRSTGVFTTWAECEAQVKGFTGCRYKKFQSSAEAQAFVNGGSRSTPKRAREDESVKNEEPKRKVSKTGTFYAVAKGHSTGIVTSKEQVDKMTVGYPGQAVYKKFESKQAATDYLAIFDTCQKSTSLTSMLEEEAGSGAGKSPQLKSSVGKAIDLKTSAPTGFASAEATADVDALVTKTSTVKNEVWYAVAKGRKTGVFQTWNECKKQVENLFSASFKKFPTKEEAEAFVDEHAAATKGQAGDPDPKDPNTLVAFCDGSALENGRRKCRAGYACIFPHREDWNVAKQLVEDRATNNRAEYMAALEGMKRANLEDPEGSRTLFIFSDSMLLIRSMTEWVGTWQKNNWKKSDGAPVQNRDLLELLMAEKGSRLIRWTHVKAHTGKKDWRSKWNDVADKAARDAALSVGA